MKRSLFPVKIVLLFLLALCFSCSRQILEVDLEYLSKHQLASYHVKTPDPALQYPSVGQTLTIRWNLPKNILPQECTIWISVRYRNHTQQTFGIVPRKAFGLWTYNLLNDEYFSTCGIVAYKAELFENECRIALKEHQLWVEIIEFKN